MLEVGQLKKISRAILFVMLLIIFYLFYMKNALEQYQSNRVTIAQTRKPRNQIESPTLVVCPEPPFKVAGNFNPRIFNPKLQLWTF